MSLSDDTIKILKASRGPVKEYATAIAVTTYDIMMTKYPVVKNYFNLSHQIKDETGVHPQAKSLANVVMAYSEHCENLGALEEAVEMITEKHVSFNITKDMYPIVADCLIHAMKEVLKTAATEEVIKGWTDAYWCLANHLIAIEEKKMSERAALAGGWRGFKKLVVTKKIKESDSVTSFYLQQLDGGKMPDGFKPGQYLSFRIPKDEIGQDYDVMRNYTLSCMPRKGYFRVSIKRDEGVGLVSHHFHDKIEIGSEIEVGMPAGSFFLDEDGERTVVLIAAGVGLTPMISMLEFLASKHKNRRVTYFQCCRTINDHPMKDLVGQIAAANSNIKAHAFYSKKAPVAVENMDIHEGRLDSTKLEELVPKPLVGNEYYFCGPRQFQVAMIDILKTFNVPQNQVHYESFEPSTIM